MTRRTFALAAVPAATLAAAEKRKPTQKPPEILPASRIHQEALFAATPGRIYAALTDSTEFAKMTGEPAEISPGAGGLFSLFGARIEGRHLELVPGERLVQAWRSKGWKAGGWSIVKFEIHQQGAQTRLVLDHTGFPEGQAESLRAGWHEHYWEPLKNYFP